MSELEENHEFKLWCIVELSGHAKIAGLVSEQTIGGATFIRIDVPRTEKHEAHTKFYGPTAIHAISPVSEELARTQAEQLETAPIHQYDIRQALCALEQVRNKMDNLPF